MDAAAPHAWTTASVVDMAEAAYSRGAENELDVFLQALDKAGALDALECIETMMACLSHDNCMAGAPAFRAMRHRNSSLLQDATRRKTMFVLALDSMHGGLDTDKFMTQHSLPSYFSDMDVLRRMPPGPSFYAAKWIPDQLLQSPTDMLQCMGVGKVFCEKFPWCLARASLEVRADADIVERVVSQSGAGGLLRYAAVHLRSDPRLLRKAVSTDAMALADVDGPARDDVELHRLAAASPAFPDGDDLWDADCEHRLPSDAYVFGRDCRLTAAFMRMFEKRIGLEVSSGKPDVALLLLKRLGWMHTHDMCDRFLTCEAFLKAAFDADCINIHQALETVSVYAETLDWQVKLNMCILNSAYQHILNGSLGDASWMCLKVKIQQIFWRARDEYIVRNAIALIELLSSRKGRKRTLDSREERCTESYLRETQDVIDNDMACRKDVEQCDAQLAASLLSECTRRDLEAYKKDAIFGDDEEADEEA